MCIRDRYITMASFDDITKTKPEKSLVFTRKKTGGRNVYGRVTSRGIGGGHKQKIRNLDLKRNKHGVDATVVAIEYAPRRSARVVFNGHNGSIHTMLVPLKINIADFLFVAAADSTARDASVNIPSSCLFASKDQALFRFRLCDVVERRHRDI